MKFLSDGKYQITGELLPERAFRAHDAESGKTVFIKRWPPGDPAWKNETEMLKNNINVHVPRLLDTFEDENGSYLAEEWIDGETLETHVGRNGPLRESEAAGIALGVCEALSFLHWNRKAPAVFLDLKPSNIMLRSGGPEIVLLDHEAALPLERSGDNAAERQGGNVSRGASDIAGVDLQNERLNRRTCRLGSQYFTAPEVLFGQADVRSDVYATGVLIGFMITGRECYPGSYSVRGPMGELIKECTDPSPEKRPAGITAVADRLRSVLAEKESAVLKTERRRRVKLEIFNFGKKPKREESGGGSGSAENVAGIPEIVRNFRRSCVMVEGNPCFISEICGVAAGNLKLRTGVFSLSERGRAKLEYHFTGVKNEKIADKELFPYIFDHKSLYLHGADKWAEKGLLTTGLTESGMLYRGTMKLGLELPLRKETDLARFVDWCFVNFDLTLFSVDRSDDRALVNKLMETCNYIIATPDSNIEDMESFRDYYLALAERGRFVYSKMRYVAWNYGGHGACRENLYPVVGSDKYLGEVFHSDARTRRKNRGEGTAADSVAEHSGQYEEILQRLIS